MRALITSFILAVVAVGIGPSGAHAAADVHVKWMNCALHPGQLDIVYIENTGDTPQDLAGWELRSDGDSERMALTPAGTIAPAQEIFVTAGAHAVNLPDEDVFLWTNDEVLRDDGDPPDYVRLMDGAGNQVSGMDCNHNLLVGPTPAPTPAPTAAEPAVQANTTQPVTQPVRVTTSQTGTRTTGSPGVVPAGGGPPAGGDTGAYTSLMAGAALALAGLVLCASAARGRPAHRAGNRKGEC